MNPGENPYQSPQAITEPVVSTDKQQYGAWADYPFVSGHRRAMWTISLLSLGILADLGGVGSTLLQVDLLERAAAVGIDESEATANDSRQMAIGLIQSVVYIAGSIAFLMWIHRAYRNLPSLGAKSLNHSPGWAVGYFFIPIANLFKPYQISREIWIGSYPRRMLDELFLQPGRGPRTALIGWWWAFWLIMNFAGQIDMRLAMYGESIDALLASSWATIVSDLISVPAALLAIAVVWRIDTNQTTRHVEETTPGEPTSAESLFSFDVHALDATNRLL